MLSRRQRTIPRLVCVENGEAGGRVVPKQGDSLRRGCCLGEGHDIEPDQDDALRRTLIAKYKIPEILIACDQDSLRGAGVCEHIFIRQSRPARGENDI